MFLNNNRRIAALISVICLALLIFCLIERQVRTAIAPHTTLGGLYAGRPAEPTGRLIFQATPEIVNVEAPWDGWARMAELQHRRGGDHQAAAGRP